MKGSAFRVLVLHCFIYSCVYDAPAVVNIDNNDNVHNYTLSETTVIRNYGWYDEINTNNKALTVYNYGYIGTIYTSGTADVIQEVPDTSALKPLHVSGAGFKANITNVQNVNVNDIKNLGATEVEISDSSIIINDFADWRNWAAQLNLNGNNTLYLVHPETVISGEEIKGINSNGTNVVLLDSDKLYKVTLTHNSGAYLINIYKETNMSNLFDDERGDLLKNLQMSNPDDPLLIAMQNARNMQELEQIMQSSYRFNPSLLMQPVKTINMLSLTELLIDENALYGNISGVYIGSKKTNGFGFNFGVGGKYEDWYLSLNFDVSKFSYKNNLNDFNGVMYGGNIKVKRYIDDLWLHGIIGMSGVKFKTDQIYYDNKIGKNPFGYSGYGALDIGYSFTVIQDVKISPFVGVTGIYSNVVNADDIDIDYRFGGNIKYAFNIDNVKYEYIGTVGTTLTGDIFGNLKMGFVSILDDAGVYLGFDVLNNNQDLNYKISISGSLLF